MYGWSEEQSKAPKPLRIGTTPEMEECAERIRNGAYHRIVILSGAGVSTGAGLPDYRGTGGLFSSLDRSVFADRARFEAEESNLVDLFGRALPTASHRLARWLDEKGWLMRVYTQNIDGLYQRAGLAEDKLIEVHGSLSKRNVVLYGDAVGADFEESVVRDFGCDLQASLAPKEDQTAVQNSGKNSVGPDLVLVMGTSLSVAPFCALPNLASKGCERLWITFHPTRSREHPRHVQARFGNRKQVSLQNTFGIRKKSLGARDRVFSTDCDLFSSLVVDSTNVL